MDLSLRRPDSGFGCSEQCKTEAPGAGKEDGITLLEIMVVLAIIGMIATLATPKLRETFGRAKSQTARIQLENLGTTLQLYYIDNGQYPSEAQGLRALLENPGVLTDWNGPYTEPAKLIDPWGREYHYRQPGKEADFDLFTLGRDGQVGGTGEDIDITF